MFYWTGRRTPDKSRLVTRSVSRRGGRPESLAKKSFRRLAAVPALDETFLTRYCNKYSLIVTARDRFFNLRHKSASSQHDMSPKGSSINKSRFTIIEAGIGWVLANA